MEAQQKAEAKALAETTSLQDLRGEVEGTWLTTFLRSSMNRSVRTSTSSWGEERASSMPGADRYRLATVCTHTVHLGLGGTCGQVSI